MPTRRLPSLLALLLLVADAGWLCTPPAGADSAHEARSPSRQVHRPWVPALTVPGRRLERWTDTLPMNALAPSAAGAAQTRPKRWSFVVAPYGWLAGTGGTITTNGEEQDFDLSFRDILKLTTGGFQLFAEARTRRFFLSFDGTWATLGHGEDLLGGRADFRVRQTILELHAGYRLLGPTFGAPRPCACPSRRGAVALDAYLGLRYWRTELDLDLAFPGRPPLIAPKHFAGGAIDQWVEPLIGGRFGLGLSPKIKVAINGNVGGFGIGDAADFTWTLSMIFNWQFSRYWSAALGWRTQSVVESSGSGVERNGSRILTTGPLVGLVLSF